ncbi:MAG: hypothetical protein M3R02_04400 [Chloroflexota bacterium]|nr:hypothetical protein [Chloroflexota bacterium]
MADRWTNPNPYLAEQVHEALAQDPRVDELGIDVEIAGEMAVLRSPRTSSQCQKVTTDTERNLLPNHHVRNETGRAGLLAPVPLEPFP